MSDDVVMAIEPYMELQVRMYHKDPPKRFTRVTFENGPLTGTWRVTSGRPSPIPGFYYITLRPVMEEVRA